MRRFLTSLRRALVPLRGRAGLVVGGVGLVLVGIAFGRLAFPIHDEAPAPLVLPTAASLETAELAMPDLGGLTPEQARRVLVDAGFERAKVSTSSVEYAGPEGLVVGQQPIPGAAVRSEAVAGVTLTLSKPGIIPDLSGKSVAEARTALAALGALGTIEEAVDSAGAVGAIVATTPAAGQPLAINVTLRVATAGDAVYIGELDPLATSRCRTTEKDILNGQQLGTSITCRPTATAAASTEFSLGRHAVFLDASVGVGDRSAPGKGTVTIFGDGKKIATVDAASGAATPVHLPVAGVLRLRIEVTGGKDAQVLLGDIRVTGTPAQINDLTTQNG